MLSKQYPKRKRCLNFPIDLFMGFKTDNPSVLNVRMGNIKGNTINSINSIGIPNDISDIEHRT